MAIISSDQSLTIPAAYIEDARRAIIVEMRDDLDSLSRDVHSEDRASDLVMLRRNQRLFDRLADDSETTVVAEQDKLSAPLMEMLGEMARLVTGRLAQLCVYAPVPFDEMLALTEQLGWAVREALRLTSELDGEAVA